MTAQQQELFERVQKLMVVVNDNGLSPDVRGAAYYRMMDLRAILEDQHRIYTTIERGRIELERELA